MSWPQVSWSRFHSACLERYHAQLAPASNITHAINSVLPISRDFLTYQEFFIAGILVALHLDDILDFVARRYRQILIVTAGVGALEVAWYVISVWSGSTIAQASDIYQPSATVWCFAAIAGLFTLSWWWDQRRPHAAGRRHERTVVSTASLAALTGGVFFAHTLFINLIRSALDGTGLGTQSPVGGDRRHPLRDHGERDGDLHRTRAPHPAALGAGRAGAVPTTGVLHSTPKVGNETAREGLRRETTGRRLRMSMAVVVGNPKPNSRTLRVAQSVADALTTRPRTRPGPTGGRPGRRGNRVVRAGVGSG